MRKVWEDAVDWYWNPDEVYEGDEPLRIVMPGERFTAIALRPVVALAKVLHLDGRVSTRGRMQIEIFEIRQGDQLPLPNPHRWSERVTLDAVFTSVMIRLSDSYVCRGVRASHGLARAIKEACKTDGRCEYLLSVAPIEC